MAAEPKPEPQQNQGRVPVWLKPDNATGALALTGVAAYGVTYLAAVLFYGPFGIDPADVGLGYAELLAQAAVYLALLFAAGAIGALLAALLAGGVLQVLSTKLLATVLTLLVAAGILVPLLFGALVDSRRARDGEAVAGTPFLDLGVDLLPWSDVRVATVQWTGQGTAPSLPACVIRLGDAAATEVLYDPQARRTLRLPQASVTVTVRPEQDACAVK